MSGLHTVAIIAKTLIINPKKFLESFCFNGSMGKSRPLTPRQNMTDYQHTKNSSHLGELTFLPVLGRSDCSKYSLTNLYCNLSDSEYQAVLVIIKNIFCKFNRNSFWDPTSDK